MNSTVLHRTTIAALTGLSLALATPPAALGQDGAAVSSSPADFSDMVAEKLPAVVGILATGPAPETGPRAQPQLPPGFGDFFGAPAPGTPPSGPSRALGSGFIISADGYVVTNNHVIAGSEAIEITLEDETRLDAELIGTDPATDIALLKVTSDADLPHVDWGSSSALEVGQWVVAMGNPFGLGGTVTAGIVSARSRDINAGPYDDFLQTDAAINSGNSGGPLFDAAGSVVGVNTAIFSPTGGNVGIGFAVPSSVAARIVEDLRENGVVERGWLGVQIQPVTDELAEALGLEDNAGALIAAVTPGSPADNAGLRAGGVVTSVAGTEVVTPRDLTFAVAELAVGEEAVFNVIENGEEREVSVTIGQQPGAQTANLEPDMPQNPDQPRLGVSVAPLSAKLRAQFAVPDDVSGVVISGVAPGSPAADAGLRRGDVIISAGGAPVSSVESLQAAVADSVDAPLLLRIYSRGAYGFRAVKPEAGSDEG